MTYAEKVARIRAGKKVRPPDRWWRAMWRTVRLQYPDRSVRDVSKITAGIWHNYSKEKQVGILKRFKAGKKGVP